MTAVAKENGINVPLERLAEEVVVQQPGYAYMYFSNDNGQQLEVSNGIATVMKCICFYCTALCLLSYLQYISEYHLFDKNNNQQHSQGKGAGTSCGVRKCFMLSTVIKVAAANKARPTTIVARGQLFHAHRDGLHPGALQQT